MDFEPLVAAGEADFGIVGEGAEVDDGDGFVGFVVDDDVEEKLAGWIGWAGKDAFDGDIAGGFGGLFGVGDGGGGNGGRADDGSGIRGGAGFEFPGDGEGGDEKQQDCGDGRAAGEDAAAVGGQAGDGVEDLGNQISCGNEDGDGAEVGGEGVDGSVVGEDGEDFAAGAGPALFGHGQFAESVGAFLKRVHADEENEEVGILDGGADAVVVGG